MVAVSKRNCAHIISTLESISWSSSIINEVNAKATAARKEPIATALSTRLSFTMFFRLI